MYLLWCFCRCKRWLRLIYTLSVQCCVVARNEKCCRCKRELRSIHILSMQCCVVVRNEMCCRCKRGLRLIHTLSVQCCVVGRNEMCCRCKRGLRLLQRCISGPWGGNGCASGDGSIWTPVDTQKNTTAPMHKCEKERHKHNFTNTMKCISGKKAARVETIQF